MTNEKLLKHAIEPLGSFPGLTRRLRLGIVGGGRISNMQATAARLTNRWEIVAGALSSDPQNSKERGQAHFLDQNRCYATYQEMAEIEASRDDGIDAVMITTPNHLHFDNAKEFLTHGIAVLCDKPLTNEVDEADELVRVTQKTNGILGVSYTMSCFPMIRQAREIIASGGIGKINQIHVEFMQDWMTAPGVEAAEHVKWRLDPQKSGKTSCVGDIATHAAHLASFVSDLKMTHVKAELHVCGAPKALEDTVFMMTRFSGGIPGTLMATRLAPGNRGGLRLRIFGSEGGLEWDLEKSEYLKFNRFGEPDQILSRGQGHGISPQIERLSYGVRGFPEGIIEAWANLYTEFAIAIAAKNDGISLPENYLNIPLVADGADGVRFIEATVKSDAKEGIWTLI